jgi:hypothetical protein
MGVIEGEDKQGRKGLITVSFNPTSSGQVSLIIYEWNDVSYLGVDTPGNEVGGVIRPVRLYSGGELMYRKRIYVLLLLVRSSFSSFSLLSSFVFCTPSKLVAWALDGAD